MAQVGKYQLIRKLATGGMAEVFLAKAAGPMGFEKTLVLKRILPHLAEDPQFVDMFLGEAKLAAQLNHPNVVQIFDFGEADGAYFIAMEYIDGPNLRALGRRAAEVGMKLPFSLVAKIVSLACEGLGYAHDFADPGTGQPLGLIHRDISPDNILLSRQGAVKVVDFGIAKAAGQGHHTKTGTLKGKLSYMPPEQLHSLPLDRRVDVYALGMVLYELVTGMKPFDATSEVSIMQAILYENLIPAKARRADVPELLQKVIEKGLAKQREERYPSCREFQSDLERFILSTNETVGGFQLAALVNQLAAAPVNPATTPVPTPKSSPGSRAVASPPLEPETEPPLPPAPPRGTGSIDIDLRTQMTEAHTPAAISHRTPARGAVDDAPVLLVKKKSAPAALIYGAIAVGMFALGGGAIWALQNHQQPPAALVSPPVAQAPKPEPVKAPEPPLAAPQPPTPQPAAVKPAVAEAHPPEPAEEPRPTHKNRHNERQHGSKTIVARLEESGPSHSPITTAVTESGLASFEIETSPAGQIRVNGRFICRSPCKVKNQPPGDLKVEVYDSQLGFAKEQVISVGPGDNGAKHITVAQGTLEFRIRPYATVFFDGKPLGQTPFPAISAYEGHHTVKLVNHDLNKDLTVDYAVRPGQTNIFKYNLEE